MQPKVTVGIPTYNRPEGVLRTIKQICAQKYDNLEIIISNNASTNELVAPLLDQCAALDSRIRVVHQQENIGGFGNFQYLLKHASADYFMWAADDDEWDIHFVSVCMEYLLSHEVGTVMPGFYWHVRVLDRPKRLVPMPKLEGNNRYDDVMAFYKHVTHHIMYGVHKKSAIMWYLDELEKDFDDEYFVVRQILQHGVLTLPDQVLFCAGVDSIGYRQNFSKEAEDRFYFHCRRLLRFAQLLNEADGLTDIHKLSVLQQAILSKLKFVLTYEKDVRNEAQFQSAVRFYHFISQLDLRYIGAYASILKYYNEQILATGYPPDSMHP